VVQVHVAPPRSQGCDPRNAGPLAPRSVGFRRLRRPFWRCRSGTYEDGPSSPVAIRPAQDARARRFIAGHLVLLRSRFPGPPRCAGEGRLLTRLVTNVAALPGTGWYPRHCGGVLACCFALFWHWAAGTDMAFSGFESLAGAPGKAESSAQLWQRIEDVLMRPLLAENPRKLLISAGRAVGNLLGIAHGEADRCRQQSPGPD
jgi:hypothetical protein